MNTSGCGKVKVCYRIENKPADVRWCKYRCDVSRETLQFLEKSTIKRI